LRNQYQRARTLSSSKSKSKTREILKSLTDGYFGGVRNENENQSSLGVRNDRRDLEGIKRNEKNQLKHSKSLNYLNGISSSQVESNRSTFYETSSPSASVNIFEPRSNGKNQLVRRSIAIQTGFDSTQTSEEKIVFPTLQKVSSPSNLPATTTPRPTLKSNPKPRAKTRSFLKMRSTKSIDGLAYFNSDFKQETLNQPSNRESGIGESFHTLKNSRSFGARLKSLGQKMKITGRGSKVDLRQDAESFQVFKSGQQKN